MKDGDEFVRAVAKVAVAQIVASVQFDGSCFDATQQSAGETLSDLLLRFLHELGKGASCSAIASGRTECSLFDVIHSLENLFDVPYAGHSPAASPVIKDLARFVDQSEPVPFKHTIPRFPVPLLPRKLKNSDAREAGKQHIPPWLPAFPDPHTYISTPVWKERKEDVRAEKMELIRQRRKAEKSLLRLQQRLCSLRAGDASDADKGKQAVEFPEQTEVFDDGRPSVLETFAPAIERAKDAVAVELVEETSILPARRRTVRFKIGVEKKPERLGAREERRDSWVLNEHETDDRKRRAVMIFRAAMDHPDELTQI